MSNVIRRRVPGGIMEVRPLPGGGTRHTLTLDAELRPRETRREPVERRRASPVKRTAPAETSVADARRKADAHRVKREKVKRRDAREQRRLKHDAELVQEGRIPEHRVRSVTNMLKREQKRWPGATLVPQDDDAVHWPGSTLPPAVDHLKPW
jgi:hypothetical protein